MKGQWNEIVRFAVVGVVATALHYLFYYLLLSFVSHNLAYTVGYALSFVCNYLLSSLFTFRVKLSWEKLAGFSLSHLLNYLAGLALLNLFILLGLSKTMAPLPVFVLVVPINFLLVRFVLKRRSGNNDGYLLFLILSGFAMLLLQLTDMPTLSDDIVYRFVWNVDEQASVSPIQDISDLVRSQCIHYKVLNGRVVVHTLAQAFYAFVPPVVLHTINALLFILLLHLLTLWVSKSGFSVSEEQSGGVKSGNSQLLVSSLSACLLFVVFRGVSTTMLWSLGTFNYLWVTVGNISLLLWLRIISHKPASLIHWLLAPLALLIGNGHEGASVPLSVAFLFYIWYHRRSILRSALFPYMLFYVVGAAVVMLSPGIWLRAADAVSLQSRLVNGVVNVVFNMRVSWLLLLSMLLLWRQRKTLIRTFIQCNRYILLAWSVSMVIIVVCGVSDERVTFFTDFFALLLLLPLLEMTIVPVWKNRFIAISLILLLFFFVPVYLLRKENQHNTAYLEQQMAMPNREIISVRSMPHADSRICQLLTERYVFPSAAFGFYSCYMGFDTEDINMRCAARLYGKQRMLFLPEDVVSTIAADSSAYSKCQLDRSGELYVYRLPGKRIVSRLTFMLSPENPDNLLPHQRLLAYSGDSYNLDSRHFKVVNLYGNFFLVFTRPTSNIYRRIHHIEYAVTNDSLLEK